MAETEQLNRLAHEALGKCWHDLSTSVEKYGGMRTYTAECVKCHNPNIPESTFQWEPRVSDFIPDYCHDLNAAAELEAFTIEKVGDAYGGYLYEVLEANGDPDEVNFPSQTEVATATAEQRTIACLKALGKMPEGV